MHPSSWRLAHVAPGLLLPIKDWRDDNLSWPPRAQTRNFEKAGPLNSAASIDYSSGRYLHVRSTSKYLPKLSDLLQHLPRPPSPPTHLISSLFLPGDWRARAVGKEWISEEEQQGTRVASVPRGEVTEVPVPVLLPEAVARAQVPSTLYLVPPSIWHQHWIASHLWGRGAASTSQIGPPGSVGWGASPCRCCTSLSWYWYLGQPQSDQLVSPRRGRPLTSSRQTTARQSVTRLAPRHLSKKDARFNLIAIVPDLAAKLSSARGTWCLSRTVGAAVLRKEVRRSARYRYLDGRRRLDGHCTALIPSQYRLSPLRLLDPNFSLASLEASSFLLQTCCFCHSVSVLLTSPRVPLVRRVCVHLVAVSSRRCISRFPPASSPTVSLLAFLPTPHHTTPHRTVPYRTARRAPTGTGVGWGYCAAAVLSPHIHAPRPKTRSPDRISHLGLRSGVPSFVSRSPKSCPGFPIRPPAQLSGRQRSAVP